MWLKMTDEQKDDQLKSYIDQYPKKEKNLWLAVSMLIAFISIAITFLLFFPNKMNLYTQIPTFSNAVRNYLFIFIPLEIIYSLICIFAWMKFKRRSIEEKREIYIGLQNHDKRKICINCGIIFDSTIEKCMQCGGSVEKISDCMWSDTPEGSDPEEKA